jgi:selenocysteine lyase/cysteine desulfurase
MISVSGHKVHAPKGIGALYIRSGLKLAAFHIGRQPGVVKTRRYGKPASDSGFRRGRGRPEPVASAKLSTM